MSSALSNGYSLPLANDTGSTVWTAVEKDIRIAAVHSHNGNDGGSLVKSATISSGGWTNFDSNTGLYSQVVTMPTIPNTIDGSVAAQLQVDNVVIFFRDSSTGERCYNKFTRTSATSYTIYSNTNTLNLTAIYI